MEQLLLTPDGPAVFSVSELTTSVQHLLSTTFEDIRVAGEISGFKVWHSGHAYFTLKDSGAQLRAVAFRTTLRYLRFQPRDGLAVVARGSIEVRQERGEYQLVVSAMEPQGAGQLQLAFEMLKQKLAAEGLFEAGRKRKLPRYPRRIGIVTSPHGAVIRDMLTIFQRRFPGLHIRLYPTLVQGEGAAAGICAGLRYFAASGWPEVVIVGRGGGSLEDLWTFNEEAVARAIAASPVPVVSAVGHETDFAIADFVADLRAPTPSAAAELIVPLRDDLLAALDGAAARATRAVDYRLAQCARSLSERGIGRAGSFVQRALGRAWQNIDELEQRLREHDPRVRLSRYRERWAAASAGLDRAIGHRLDADAERLREVDAAGAAAALDRRLAALRQRVESVRLRLERNAPHVRLAAAAQRLQSAERSLSQAVERRLGAAARRFEPLPAQLAALSPLAVLDRGYSIVQTEAGRLVRCAADAPPGTALDIRLRQDRLKATAR